MNIIERQANVARQLVEINLDTTRKMFELTGSGMRHYLDLNAKYLERIRQPEGLRDVLELQRDYGQSLVSGVRDDLRERGSLLKQALEQTSSVLTAGWKETQETLAGQLDAVTDKVKDVAEDLRDEVEEKIDEQLEQINGVGSTFAAQLREAGVYTLAQVAMINTADLADEDHPLHHMRSRMESEDWVQQARDLLNPLH